MADSPRYAILGDIHANLEALEAVIEDARERGVTDFVCMGDIVGYNANPVECIRLVRELGCVGVRGNHDHNAAWHESLEDFHPLAAAVLEWTRKRLSAEDEAYLKGLELRRMVRGFTLVHSTLDMPERWGYVTDALDAEAHFTYQTTTLCFCGHTHVPVVYEREGRVQRREFDRFTTQVGHRYFVNVGSVGQPRDGDPRAAYGLLDVASRSVELHRVPYDVETTQDKILKAGLPQRLALRLALGR
jgi:diadenosine tetraphosphatase ApaH/serine/threonine PP2A family protein phosphatase